MGPSLTITSHASGESASRLHCFTTIRPIWFEVTRGADFAEAEGGQEVRALHSALTAACFGGKRFPAVLGSTVTAKDVAVTIWRVRVVCVRPLS